MDSFRKKCRRFDIPGQAHCLTFSTYKRQKLFPGRFAATWFLDSLSAARSRAPFDLWAYVIMPEHVHLVILPHELASISKILQAIKKPLTDRLLNWARRNSPSVLDRLAKIHADGRTSHHFWQPGGGFDRNLRSLNDIYEKIDYIHANPVRRNLVTNPGAWKWSSYVAWTLGDDSLISLDRRSLPPRLNT